MKPYYDHAGITIYHGDCRDVMPGLDGVDVLVTDPPYGLSLGSHGGASDKRTRELRKGCYESYDDTIENYKTIVAPAISEAIVATKRGAVFAAAPAAWSLPAPVAVGGVYIPAASGRTPWGFQNLSLVLFYGVAPDLNKGAKHTTVRRSSRVDAGHKHPCPKPIMWMLWLVDLSSKQDEIILDPFMGSGTTLRAAKDLGRKAIGIEMEEKYCEMAAKRMSQEVMDFGEKG